MTLEERISAFAALGQFMGQFASEPTRPEASVPHNGLFLDRMETEIGASQSRNGWFTPKEVRFALGSWAKALTTENLAMWVGNHEFPDRPAKTIGLVLAGNIPLVGFHDFLSVLITGNKVLAKLSSSDQKLLPLVADYLIAVEPAFGPMIQFTEDKLGGFDAVIATGSNNTARYFEYYFKDVPSIIRRNRNSVAVLTGDESRDELVALGEDIFRYFGLGCRNVSKLFVPRGYDFAKFFDAMYEYRDIVDYEKYSNNYDYNKAVFLMSRFEILDNGFMTIKEDSAYASPISSVFYEYYDTIGEVSKILEEHSEKIQCTVAGASIPRRVPFGRAQHPELWDYADGVDTLTFLANL